MTCAKKTVICALITESGTVVGTNNCDNPQPKCPREFGEDYEKCTSVCQQPYHAEMDALQKAEGLGWSTKGAIAVVFHWRVCDSCQRSLRDAGVTLTIITEMNDARHNDVCQQDVRVEAPMLPE